jgi:phosphatidate cytidylyltransferase
MLLTRFITSVVLLGVLALALFSGSQLIVAMLCAIFFAAATWECSRLFKLRTPKTVTAVLTALFVAKDYVDTANLDVGLFGLSFLVLVVLVIPALKQGLPSQEGKWNQLFCASYFLSIFACFWAIETLFISAAVWPVLLLSVLAIVWVADIGAYFVGKAFGRKKLAPSISPGKSWEGALGGWLLALLYAVACSQVLWLQATFPSLLKAAWGWLGLVSVITVLVATSVVGDLFESQLKRRSQVKDSSHLLPGHGGVLDRIDSLIFMMPLVVLILGLMRR